MCRVLKNGRCRFLAKVEVKLQDETTLADDGGSDGVEWVPFGGLEKHNSKNIMKIFASSKMPFNIDNRNLCR